jgi:phage major head subunit gpT-like protein
LVAEKAIELIGANLRVAYANGADLLARSYMLMGSLLAGMALAIANVGMVHALAQTLGATGAVESQAWMSPVPDPREIVDERIPFGLLDVAARNVRMRKYGSGFRVSQDDMEDEKLGLYTGKPAELFNRCRRGVATTLLSKIAAARTELSFEDGTTMEAADTHTIGTGDNLIPLTTTDKTAETIAFLYTGGPIKPVLWYDRKAPELKTDINSPEADERGYYRWWAKYRGAATFGFWWDFVFVVADGIPTIAEFQTMLGDVEAAFRSFQLPDGSYIHEQTEFNASNLVAVVSPNLAANARLLSSAATVVSAGVAVENPSKGMFSFITANGMNQA